MNKWKKVTGVTGLYLHTNGKYYLRRNYPKRSFQSLRTSNLKEAKYRLKTFINSQYGRVERNERRIITFGDIAEEFVKQELPQQPIRTKTKENISQSLKQLKKQEDIWKTPLNELSSKVLTKFIEQLPCVSNAKRNYFSYSINKVFDYGTDLQLIKEGTLEKVKSFPTKARKVDLPSDQKFEDLVTCLLHPKLIKRKRKSLPKDWKNKTTNQLMREMKASLSTVKRRITEEKNGKKSNVARTETVFTFLFLCYTGLRKSEATNLKWGDVKKDQIVVRGTKSNASNRVLPIWKKLEQILDQIKGSRLSTEKNENVLKCKRIDKQLGRACKYLKIPYLRHHDLRHYFATKSIQAGVDIPTVAKWLGHADGGVMVMKVYTNIMNQHSIDQANKLKFGVNTLLA
jgi:integrase